MLLTDEEIQKEGTHHSIIFLQKKAVAKAQLKRVVEWLNNPKRTFFNGAQQIVMLEPEDWQALLGEVKDA